MAANVPLNLTGGISYKPVSYTWGDTSQAIGGGFAFDLPLATVAAFTNTGLDFASQNSAASRGFLSGVMSNAQSVVTQMAGQSYSLQNNALSAIQEQHQREMDLQRYMVKKKFGMGSADFLSGKASCFITTAVTQAKGLSDNCAELQSLRKFRDEYLLTTDEGKALVKTYYEVAPAIVEAINARADAASVWARLDNNFIQSALQWIGAGHFEVAKGIYMALVHEAANLAGLELAPATATVVCDCGAGKKALSFHKKTCALKAE